MTCPQVRPTELDIRKRGKDKRAQAQPRRAASGGRGRLSDTWAGDAGRREGLPISEESREGNMTAKDVLRKRRTERARQALDGLGHCMPEGKDGGGCGGCPYLAEDGCACEDREMVYLPLAMIEDIRTALKQALAAYEETDGKEGNG